MSDPISQSPEMTSCPRCHRQITVFRTVRWCPECEWNLDRYDPDRHGHPFGWSLLDRLAYRAAHRLNARQFAALASRDLAAKRASLARASVLVISAALLAVVLAMFVAGIALIAVTLELVAPMVARAARNTGDAAEWRAAADASHHRSSSYLPQLRQLSISDEASLFASHPPTGMRRRMVEAKPWRDAKVNLTEHQSAQIDTELAAFYARARKEVAALV
jgi:hypothetical protein